ITLPEAKPVSPFGVPGGSGQGFGAGNFKFGGFPKEGFGQAMPGQPGGMMPHLGQNLGGFISRGLGDRGVMTTVFRSDKHITARHQEGSLIITLTGTVADGKAKTTNIEIQDGSKNQKYESLEDVPGAYKDKVRNLI